MRRKVIMTGIKLVAAIIIMAVVTYIIRMLPLTFFRKKIRNRYVKAFLNFIPFAVLSSMTFPDVFYSTGSKLSAAIGTGAAFLLAYKGKSLLTVSLISCAVVFAVDFVCGMLV